MKDKVLKLIQETRPKVVDIEITGNFVKCYEQEDLFGKQVDYYVNDLKYWLEKIESQTDIFPDYFKELEGR